MPCLRRRAADRRPHQIGPPLMWVWPPGFPLTCGVVKGKRQARRPVVKGWTRGRSRGAVAVGRTWSRGGRARARKVSAGSPPGRAARLLLHGPAVSSWCRPPPDPPSSIVGRQQRVGVRVSGGGHRVGGPWPVHRVSSIQRSGTGGWPATRWQGPDSTPPSGLHRRRGEHDGAHSVEAPRGGRWAWQVAGGGRRRALDGLHSSYGRAARSHPASASPFRRARTPRGTPSPADRRRGASRCRTPLDGYHERPGFPLDVLRVKGKPGIARCRWPEEPPRGSDGGSAPVWGERRPPGRGEPPMGGVGGS